MGGMRRFPSWIIVAVLVVSAVNAWAIWRHGSVPSMTASQVARRDDVTRLVTDGETAASGKVEPTDLWWSDLRFEQITWAEWNNERAAGHATLVADTCQPSCADGNTESYLVDLEVSGAATVCGGRFFSTLTWTPTGAGGKAGFLDNLLPNFLEQSTDWTTCR